MSKKAGVVTCGRYIAWDEGCIECGQPSGIVGIYTAKARAKEALKTAENKQSANWHGQHHFYIIDLKELEPKSEWSK